MVRFDWTTHCGACGAQLLPGQQPTPFMLAPVRPQQANPLSAAHKAMIGGAIVLVVVLGAVGVVVAQPKPDNSKSDYETAGSISKITAESTTTSTTSKKTTTTTTPLPTGDGGATGGETTSGLPTSYTFTMKLTSDTQGTILDVTGAADVTHKLMRLDYTGSKTATMIFDLQNDVAYETDASQPASKPWIKVTGMTPIQMSSSDPTGGKNFLSLAGAGATKLGIETVDGVQCTHYSLTNGATGSLGGLLSSDADTNTKKAETWLDKDSNIRKFLVVTDATDSGQGTATITGGYTNFNKAPGITVPSSSLVSKSETSSGDINQKL